MTIRPHFERRMPIRFAHCDPAGIVFFPQYLVMFNGLVEDWFTEGMGISYAQMIGARHIGLPIVRLNCDFVAISGMGDEVTLGLTVQRVGRSSLTLAIGCSVGEQQRVRSQQVLVFTSLDTHRAIAIPPDVAEALTTFTPQLQRDVDS